MRGIIILPLVRHSSSVAPISTVHRGVAYEARCMRVLQENFSMSLRRVGGKSDGGIDLQGWWWLPTSQCAPDTGELFRHRRIRILAQCKAEKKKMGPAYLRELEGVLHRCVVGSTHSDPSQVVAGPYPVVGLFLSSSSFTKQALLHIQSSPLPFCLLHIPEADVDADVDIDAAEPGETKGIGSVVFNHALSSCVLRGEIEARWERPLNNDAPERPGLWWNGERIRNWTPRLEEDIIAEIDSVRASNHVHVV